MSDSFGRGPALVLLPGGPGLDNYLGPLAELLAPHARVILPDPPSGGDWSLGPAMIVAMTAELDRLRADAGVATWLVGGHSFGADLALAYALEHPDRTAGVLSICGTGVQDDRQWHAAYETGRAEGRDPDHLDGIGFDAAAHRIGLAAWRSYIKQPDLLARIGRLPMEFQAVYGSEDVRPRWPIDQLAALVPNGRVDVIDGAGHWPWLTHPRETVAIIAAFVQSATGSAPRFEYAGIDHVQLAMPAGREDEARRFYADVLGLREVPKPPGSPVVAPAGSPAQMGASTSTSASIPTSGRPARRIQPLRSPTSMRCATGSQPPVRRWWTTMRSTVGASTRPIRSAIGSNSSKPEAKRRRDRDPHDAEALGSPDHNN